MSKEEKNDWEFKHLEIKKENFVTTIVMDHPPLSNLDTRVNTMGPALVDELGKVQDLLYNDHETRVIILRGSKNYFSGGGDFGGEPPTEPRNIAWSVKKGVVKGQRVFKRFRDIPIPVIAAIEGYAGGGGLEIAMSCDLRYATEDTVFRQIETAVGMIPGWGGTQLMARHIGVGRTMELMLLGKEFSAQRAYEIGLINGVFSEEDFEKEVYEVANYIVAQCAPIATGIGKQMVNFGGTVPIDVGLEMESYGYGIVAGTTDFIEGLMAAGQGRPPKYKNK